MNFGDAAPAVLAAGAITALGPTLRHTALFLRAGQDHIVPSPFIDALGEHIAMNANSILPVNLMGAGRLSALATRACRDALRDLADGVVRSPRLCLVLPQRYASRTREVSGIEEAVREVLPKPLSLAPSSLLFGAGAVGTRAIAEAAQQVSQRQCDAVLICAVDSYYDWEVLERLIGADQLLTADNLDGRRPGEAAVAVLLSDAQHPWSGQYGCLLRGVGLAEEPIPLGSEHPSRAEGITSALEAAMGGSQLAAGSVTQFLSDTTHEAYRIRELQLVLARFGSVMGQPFELLLPARELGEVGAASLLLYAALVAEANRRGFGWGPLSLAFAGGEEALRGAVLMQNLDLSARRML